MSPAPATSFINTSSHHLFRLSSKRSITRVLRYSRYSITDLDLHHCVGSWSRFLISLSGLWMNKHFCIKLFTKVLSNERKKNIFRKMNYYLVINDECTVYSIKNTSSQFQKMVQPTQALGFSILYLYSIRSEFFKYQILSLWYYQDFLTQKKNVILKCTNRIFLLKRLGFFHKRLGFLHKRLGFFHKDKNRSI